MSSTKSKNLIRGRRLREARKKAGLTQQQLASRVGCTGENISSIERGEWGLSGALLLNVERDLNLRPGWLDDGAAPIYKEGRVGEGTAAYGFAVPTGVPEDIPVVGRGRGGRGEFNVDGYPVGEGYKRVRRPFDVDDPQAFGVEVSGESMAPRYEPGDVVICSPKKPWKSGDYCVVIKEDGEALVKKVKDLGASVILSSLAPGVDPIMLHKKEIRAIHKIVWKKER